MPGCSALHLRPFLAIEALRLKVVFEFGHSHFPGNQRAESIHKFRGFAAHFIYPLLEIFRLHRS